MMPKTNAADSGWRQVNNKKSKTSSARGNKMQGTTTNKSEGVGGMLSLVGFIDLRFMFQTRKADKIFHLA
jgi:hypothetical protein